MPPLKLFNLDLHISVIEDCKSICRKLYGDAIEITNWSISDHNWVFNKKNVNVDIITQETWTDIDLKMIKAFQKRYDSFLETFDGFIVTHTPVFTMLFEKYNKPILCINTCRYDQPFCWSDNTLMRDELNLALIRMVQKKQLLIVSNNSGDFFYLLEGTRIQSTLLPSLCQYTESSHKPTKSIFTVFGDRTLFPESQLLVEKPQKGYSWQELCSYKGIVHCPYEMSTMSIFEQYWAGVPLFFPTKRFYKQCIMEAKMDFISIYSNNDLYVGTEEEIDNWLEKADFYLYPYLYYYDSFEECIQMLETFQDINKDERLQWLDENKTIILERWKKLLDTLWFLV